VRVWPSIPPGHPRTVQPHSRGIVSIAFDSSGTRLISASWDSTLKIWPVDGPGDTVELRHPNLITTARFSPQRNWVVVSAGDTAYLWNLADPREPQVFGHDGWVSSAAPAPDGSSVVTSVGHIGYLWNTATRARDTLPAMHGGQIHTVAFSPTGRSVLTASNDSVVRIFSVDLSGADALTEHDGPVITADFSPKGDRVVSGTSNTLGLGNSEGGSVYVTIEGAEDPIILGRHDAPVVAASFSRDGNWIVSTARNGDVRVWPADGTGEPVILAAAGQPTNSTFNPDASLIATGYVDGTTKIWSYFQWTNLIDLLDRARTDCLSTRDRLRYLGESRNQREERHRECQRRHGVGRTDRWSNDP
jgi:WD40 repeat protein